MRLERVAGTADVEFAHSAMNRGRPLGDSSSPVPAPGAVFLFSFSYILTMVSDHGIFRWKDCMEEIAISKFKATCLAVLERVRKTGKPVLVTRFGAPVAEVIPPQVKERPTRELGTLRGTARIMGDVVSPATDEDDWEVLRS